MHVYLFEAKKLQGFIFATGKLRDASGASELLNEIAFETGDETQAGDLVQHVLSAAKVGGTVTHIRRASGAGVLVFKEVEREAVARFRTLWRLAVVRHAPGIGFVDALASTASIPSDFGNADDKPLKRLLDYTRHVVLPSQPPLGGLNLPLTAPMVRLAGRTGTAPAYQDHEEYVDATTMAKRAFLRRNENVLAAQFSGDEPEVQDLKWPTVLDPSDHDDNSTSMPMSERHRVAVLHADGNGVGQMFIDAAKELEPDELCDLSVRLASATKAAAQQATLDALVAKAEGGILPARPIILGGDDLTLVVRSDCALSFTTSYLKAFESQTRDLFGYLRQTYSGRTAFLTGDCLSAKAGLAFVGRKQPFSRAYELCESLASAAKAPNASRVSFWRVVSSQFEQSTDQIRARADTGPFRLWRPSWSLEALENLQNLVEAMSHEAVGRGALRRVPELLTSDSLDEAKRVYRSALDAAKRESISAHGDLLKALEPFGLTEETAPFAEYDSETQYCPLLDAHSLAQIT